MQEPPAADGDETESNSLPESETHTDVEVVPARAERTEDFSEVEEVVEEDELSVDDGTGEPPDSENAAGTEEVSEVEDDNVEEDEEEDDVVEEGAEEPDAVEEELDAFEEDATVDRANGESDAHDVSQKPHHAHHAKGDTAMDSPIDEKSMQDPARSTPDEGDAPENGTTAGDMGMMHRESVSVAMDTVPSKGPAAMDRQEQVISSFPTPSNPDMPFTPQTATVHTAMQSESETDKGGSVFTQKVSPLFGQPKSAQEGKESEPSGGFSAIVPPKPGGGMWNSAVTSGAFPSTKPLFGSTSTFGAPQSKPSGNKGSNLDTKPVNPPSFGHPAIEGTKTSAEIWGSASTAGAFAQPKPLFGSSSSFGAPQFKPTERKPVNMDNKVVSPPLFGLGAPVMKKDTSVDDKSAPLVVEASVTTPARDESKAQENETLVEGASGKQEPSVKSPELMSVTEPHATSKGPGSKDSEGRVTPSLPTIVIPAAKVLTESVTLGTPVPSEAEAGKNSSALGQTAPLLFGQPKPEQSGSVGVPAVEGAKPTSGIWGSAETTGAFTAPKPLIPISANPETSGKPNTEMSDSPMPAKPGLGKSESAFGQPVAPLFGHPKPEEDGKDSGLNAGVPAVEGAKTGAGIWGSAGTLGAFAAPKPLFGSASTFGAPQLKPSESKAMDTDTKVVTPPLFGLRAPVTKKATTVSEKVIPNVVEAPVTAPTRDESMVLENETAVEGGSGKQEPSVKSPELMSVTEPDATMKGVESKDSEGRVTPSLPTTASLEASVKPDTAMPDNPMSAKPSHGKSESAFGQPVVPLFGQPKPEQDGKDSGQSVDVPAVEGAKTGAEIRGLASTIGAFAPPKQLFGSASSLVAPQSKPAESKAMNLDTKVVSTPLFGLGVPATKQPVSFSVTPTFQTSLSPSAPSFVPGAAKHKAASLSLGEKPPDTDIPKQAVPMDSAPSEKHTKEWSHVFNNINLLVVKPSAPEVKKILVGKKEGTFKLELFKDKNGTFLNVVRTDTKEEVYLSLKVGADVLKCGRIKGRPDRLAVTRLGSAVPKVTTESDPAKFFAVFPTQEDCSSLYAAFSSAIAADLPASEGEKIKTGLSTSKVQGTSPAKTTAVKALRPSANTGKSIAPVPAISKSAKLAAKKKLALQKMQLAKAMKLKNNPAIAPADAAKNSGKPKIPAFTKQAPMVGRGTSSLAEASNVESGNGTSLSGAKRQAGVAFKSEPAAKKKKGDGAKGKQNLSASFSEKNALSTTPMDVAKPVAPTPGPGTGPTATKIATPVNTHVGGNVSGNDESARLRKQLDEQTSKYELAVQNAKQSEASNERKLKEALEKQTAQESSLAELTRTLESTESKSAQLKEARDNLSRLGEEVLNSAVEGLDAVTSRLKEAMSKGSAERLLSLGQCRPQSTEDFLARLWSFQPSTWYGFMEKGVIDPQECALRGWYNSGPNQLSSSDGVTIKFDVGTLSNPKLYDEEVNRVRELVLGKGHALLSGWLGNSCPNEFRDLFECTSGREGITSWNQPQ